MVDDLPVACTVSVGAACHDDIDCDLNTLFHLADGALYSAKSAGRNRVELLGPEGIVRTLDAGVLAHSNLSKLDGHEGADTWRNTRLLRQATKKTRRPQRARRGAQPLS
jgi:hypothetical protein